MAPPRQEMMCVSGVFGTGCTNNVEQWQLRCRTDPPGYCKGGISPVADENLGTCLLIGPSDINQPKATTLANFIPGAVGYKEEVESSIRSRVGIDFDVSAIVVNGLDHIGAR